MLKVTDLRFRQSPYSFVKGVNIITRKPIVTSDTVHNIVIPHEDIEVKHAVIKWEENSLQIMDLYSLTGIILANKLLTPGVWHNLNCPQDTLRIGDLDITVVTNWSNSVLASSSPPRNHNDVDPVLDSFMIPETEYDGALAISPVRNISSQTQFRLSLNPNRKSDQKYEFKVPEIPSNYRGSLSLCSQSSICNGFSDTQIENRNYTHRQIFCEEILNIYETDNLDERSANTFPDSENVPISVNTKHRVLTKKSSKSFADILNLPQKDINAAIKKAHSQIINDHNRFFGKRMSPANLSLAAVQEPVAKRRRSVARARNNLEPESGIIRRSTRIRKSTHRFS